MKLISWNVNGLRACVQKGFLDIFKELDADMFCIQERLSSVLELCDKKRLFRNGHLYQKRANVRGIRHRYRRT